MSADTHQIFRTAVEVVASRHGAPVSAISAPSGRAARGARLLACYLAHVGAAVPVKRLAAAAGLDPRGVSRGLARIEDRRDDRRIDCLLTDLEEAFHGARAA